MKRDGSTLRIVSTTLANVGNVAGVVRAVDSVCAVIDYAIHINTSIGPTWCSTPGIESVEWPWQTHFGAARQAALDIASKHGGGFDWMLMVDSDEAAVIPDPAALRSYLAALPASMQVVLVRAADGSHLRERLFRLPARARWIGRTHEAFPVPLDQQAVAPESLVTWTELPKTQATLVAKFERDVEMLRADIADDATDGRAFYYLGVTLRQLGKYEEAADAFRSCASFDGIEGGAWACFQAAEIYLDHLRLPDRAIDAALAGLARDSGIAELAWVAARASLGAGRTEQARCWSALAKVHGDGSEAERRRVGFRVPRGLTHGPDEVRVVAASVRDGVPLSPDGVYYLRAVTGPVPRPYAFRWALPWAIGEDPKQWRNFTRLYLALTPAVAWSYFGTMGLAGWTRAFAVTLLCVLPGVWRTASRYPVLTDAPAFALTLATAHLVRDGHPWLAGLLALLLGATRESGPIFAALWAWHPLPLVGLLAAGWWRKHAEPDAAHLLHPIRSALALRHAVGFDWRFYVKPWGAALAGLAVAPSWQLAATLVVAHAQLFTALDTVRLAVWAAPVLVVAAVQVIPLPLAVLAVIGTLALQTGDDIT